MASMLFKSGYFASTILFSVLHGFWYVNYAASNGDATLDPEIAENRPELLARHCTEAGLIEKAAGLWGKAGERSLERSALVEAVAQLTRALAQIAALPTTPALRREQIKLQVALITPLIHVKGYAAPETKAAVERAHTKSLAEK